MSDFNISTPVYLVTGVLESGKTSFLDFTAKQDYFQIEGTTLLITCEEGEEEYDEKELLNTTRLSRRLKSRRILHLRTSVFCIANIIRSECCLSTIRSGVSTNCVR